MNLIGHLARRWLLALCATMFVLTASAQNVERSVLPELEVGAPVRSFDDVISDFEAVSYVVPMQEGQSLHVLLATNNASNCFDIHAPDMEKPVYLGGELGNTHRLRASKSGDYIVRVYLLRLAARDGQSAQYTLELKVTADSATDLTL